MSVVIQDNFSLAAAKAVDNRYEKVTSGGTSVPYANLSEAYTAIPLVYRHIGLTVAIDNGSGGATEYWFKNDTNTLVPKSGAVANADNGLNLTSGYVKLGGALTQSSTTITGTDQSLNFTLNSSATNMYTRCIFDKFIGIIQSGSLPNAIDTAGGSMTRALTFKTTGGIWTTNYTSYAYEAQTRWLQAHPWITPPLDDAHSFQIYDNIISTNQSSAIISHYYDERVGSPNWQDTWTGGHTLVAGKVYTLRTKVAGDNFPATIASSTISGSANTSGWVFTSNGNQPTVWTNGSTVDGDYPVITYDPKFSIVSCELATAGEFVNKGVVNVKGNSVTVNCLFDQRPSKRGLIVGQYTTANRPAANSVQQGELFYNVSTNLFEYSDGVSTWYKITSTTV